MRYQKILLALIPALLLCAAPTASQAAFGIGVSVNIAPPALPVYEQPPLPAPGYIWTPGYWAWDGSDYYWVPGTWVEPPQSEMLWTPGYWGWNDGLYVWNAGYWGPQVGFYGGVNYGFGYVGVGYVGGRWDGDRYHYNTSVNNVNTTIVHNTYNQTVVNNVTVNNVTVNKVSYNGGSGGVAAAPTAQERVAAHEPHVAPTPLQRQHVQEATRNPALAAQANGGHPAIAATPRPAAFNAPGVVGARGAPALPPRSPMAGQPNGAPNGARAPAATGQPNAGRVPPAAAAGQPSGGGRGAAYGRPPGQPGAPQPAARPQGQPAAQARPQGQPAAQARPQAQQPQQRKAPPEAKKGERERDR
jgi:WXXGXW repeat (2 copies)